MNIKELKVDFILKKLSVLIFLFSFKVQAQSNDRVDLTAHKAGGAYTDLNLEDLPEWSNDDYRDRFKEIRDKKFLTYDGEARRIPWLYNRDGCHMRATHFIDEADRLGYEPPKRVFMFGSIEMKGAMTPTGSVEPWFHAAPIVKVKIDGVEEAMVLDPAVNFARPLKLERWVSLIAKDRTKTIYSICESNTYLPTTSCKNPGPVNVEHLEGETQRYLRFERNILKNLGLIFN